MTKLHTKIGLLPPHRNLLAKKFIVLSAMLICFLFCRESFGALPPDIDLEEMAQDYILEVKQLTIPGYPTACNPSIVRWQDKLILSFNAYSIGKEDQPDLMVLLF